MPPRARTHTRRRLSPVAEERLSSSESINSNRQRTNRNRSAEPLSRKLQAFLDELRAVRARGEAIDPRLLAFAHRAIEEEMRGPAVTLSNFERVIRGY